MRLNAPIIGPQMMPNNGSITVEKKRHTLKNTVMSLPNKLIVFLGRTFSGHNHDYLMLKQEFPPELDWFTDINVRVDLGYLGIQSDYRGDRIAIPTKKPRKSKKHPNPQLSDEQKAANTALSRVRIFIEHAMGGMKRYNILVHTFRNRIEHFEAILRTFFERKGLTN
jgi:DDE superfamily endonuclease